MASVVFVFFMVILVTFMRMTSLMDAAEILPGEETEGFIVFDVQAYLDSGVQFDGEIQTEMLSFLSADTSWFGGDAALAMVGGELVTIYEAKTHSKADNFLNSMLVEGEEFEIVHGENTNHKISCFPISHPNCFILTGRKLIISQSVEALQAVASVQDGTPSVEQTETYQNARGRLPYFGDAFIYMDLQSARMEFIKYMSTLGLIQPGYLETMLHIFPSLAMTIDMEPTHWTAELFAAVNKDALDGEAFFHHDQSYKRNLLGLGHDDSADHDEAQDFALEWGGQDLTAQLQRMSEILTLLNSSAAIVFDSNLAEWSRMWFGEQAQLEDLYQLLEGEYYLGYTPAEYASPDLSTPQLFLALELPNEAAKLQAEAFKDSFASSYKIMTTVTGQGGETYAEYQALTGQASSLDGGEYGTGHHYKFTIADENGESTDQHFLDIAILDSLLVVSTSQERFQTAVDTIQAGQSPEKFDTSGLSLWGADEVTTLNLEFFTEAPILSLVQSVTTTRKIFHDGIYARYAIELASTPNASESSQSEPEQAEAEYDPA